jgi:hypothetical protein
MPFTIDKTSIVKAKAYEADILPGATLVEKVRVYEWKNAANITGLKPGVAYRYYEPPGRVSMHSINDTPKISGTTDVITAAKKQRVDRFAFEFSGYVKIAKDGMYTFFTRSDDGSKLFIDDEEVVDNDGDHGTVEKTGKAALKKGYHKILVLYFDSGGGNELNVLIQAEGGKKTEIPKTMLFR